MAYDVFISYSRKDAETVDQIREELQKNGISYFIDREDIPGGEQYLTTIFEAINDSKVFLFIGSYNSYYAKSKMPVKELTYACDNKEEDTIIPYRIDQEKLPGNLLLLLSTINIRNSTEHSIATLIEDIQKALEKTSPELMEEDILTAKKVSRQIAESAHTDAENIDMLAELAQSCMDTHRRSNRISEAEIFYREAIKIKEHSTDESVRRGYDNLYYDLAQILKRKQVYSESAKLYQTYLDKQSPSDRTPRSTVAFRKKVECHLNLAEVQFAVEDYESAESNCRAGIDLIMKKGLDRIPTPTIQRIAELRVKTLQRLGMLEESVTVYDQIINHCRKHLTTDRGKNLFSEILFAFSQSLIGDGLLDKAKAYLEEAIENDSDNAKIFLKLADTYATLNDRTKAFDAYETAFKIALKEDGYLSSSNLEDTLMSIVAFISKTDAPADAEEFFDLALAKFKLDVYFENISGIKIGGVYEDSGDWFFKQKRYSEAKARFRQCLGIIERYPDHQYYASNRLRIYCRLALIDYRTGFSDKARADVEKAVEITPAGTDSKVVRWIKQVNKTWEILRTENFTEGTQILQRVLVDYSKNQALDDMETDEMGSYCTTIGWTLLLMEEYAAAKKPLEEALKIEKKQNQGEGSIANAKINLARLYIGTGLLDKAEVLLKEAYPVFQRISETDPTRLHYLAETEDYWGRLMMARKRYDEAESYFKASSDHYRQTFSTSSQFQGELDDVTLLLEKAKAMQGE